MKKYVILLILISTGIFLFLKNTQTAEEVCFLRLTHSFNQNHPIHIFLKIFGDELNVRTQGKIKTIIYDSAQLGAEPQFAEQIALSVLDGGVVSCQFIARSAPEFASLLLPYSLKDELHARYFLNSYDGKQLLKLFPEDKVNLHICCPLVLGMNGFFFKKTMEEFEKKDSTNPWRIAYSGNPLIMDYFKRIGLQPVPVAKGEIYSAIQMGMIEAGENSLTGMVGAKYHETAKHFLASEHTVGIYFLVVGKHVMIRLTDEEKQAVRDSWKYALKKFYAVKQPDPVFFAEKNKVSLHLPSSSMTDKFHREAASVRKIAEQDLRLQYWLNKIDNCK